tara:strand:- start:187 stop:1269 length:1083 start_codon:yes stop_codon:yes gene_type:complete
MLSISPKDPIDHIQSKIQRDDVFCIPDHFNLPGIPNHETSIEYTKTNSTKLDEIVLSNPNKLFFFFNNPQFVNGQPNNCIFLPLYFMCQIFQHKQHGRWPEISLEKKNFTTCTIGGRNRWHRSFLSFWCALYLKSDKFRYTMMENNDLTELVPLIESSACKVKLDKKKFLHKKYIIDSNLPLRYGAVDEWSYDDPSFFYNYLMPEITGQSYINFITEAHSLELHGALTEMSIRPFISYNFPLWLGSYKHHKLFRKLGFDVFGDVLKHNHLSTLDRYQSVIQGLEDNKHLFDDIDLCHEHYIDQQKRLEHNKRLALDIDHFFDVFRKDLKLFIDYYNKSNLNWTQVDLHPDFLALCNEKMN